MADEITKPTLVPAVAHLRQEDLAEVELLAAEAKAQVATIEAIGKHFQLLLETPGVKSFLEDAGRSLIKRWEVEVAAAEHTHVQIMKDKELEDRQCERNAKAAESDKKLGVLFLLGAACFGVFLLWLVQRQYLPSNAALALTTILSVLFGWLRAEAKRK